MRNHKERVKGITLYNGDIRGMVELDENVFVYARRQEEFTTSGIYIAKQTPT